MRIPPVCDDPSRLSSLAIVRLEGVTSAALAALSSGWRAPAPHAAALVLGAPSDEATVIGAFQRARDVSGQRPVLRRGSGGPAVLVGPGTVWLQLSLARPDALVATATADKLLNRYVRPLLRALTRVTGVPASYFGRDWISAAHRPVALVAFAHEASTGASFFEAVVAVKRAFAEPRPSFLGKAPATLEEIAGRAVELDVVESAIAEAYGAAAGEVERAEPPALGEAATVAPEPAWSATREEAIGVVAAGRDAAGRVRVGGELMASGDAMARLEERIAALPPGAGRDDVGRVVDETLASGGAVTFGVRSLASIRDVIVEVLSQP